MKTLTIIVLGIFLISLAYAVGNYVTYDFEKSTYKNVTKEVCRWEIKKEYEKLNEKELQIIIEGIKEPTINDFYNRICEVINYKVEVKPSKDYIIEKLKEEIAKLEAEKLK